MLIDSQSGEPRTRIRNAYDGPQVTRPVVPFSKKLRADLMDYLGITESQVNQAERIMRITEPT